MSTITSAPPAQTIPPPTTIPPVTKPMMQPLAGVLSYLVPGLGQIYQGRTGKGLLFLVCIYGLFFYGIYLGTRPVKIDGETYRISSNVYLPNAAEEKSDRFPPVAQNLYTRPQFAGQFWVGVAAWPAIAQYWDVDRRARLIEQKRADISRLRQEGGDNVDPLIVRLEEEIQLLTANDKHRLFGDFEREPSNEAQNALQNASDKRLELAWVYTVIAGVLNILVIYDALAGPAYGFGGVGNPENKVA